MEPRDIKETLFRDPLIYVGSRSQTLFRRLDIIARYGKTRDAKHELFRQRLCRYMPPLAEERSAFSLAAEKCRE